LAYQRLDLITFFTAGEKEVRAWTVKSGAEAPQAAAKIHTDMQRGFIAADVISWHKLVEANGWKQAKEKGWVRLEGKNYIMKDGDVMIVRFNV
jgi:ribosome-binding ATPase YchF (GTP1/OBG family)